MTRRAVKSKNERPVFLTLTDQQTTNLSKWCLVSRGA